MPGPRGVPPGRGGRVYLAQRIGVGTKAVELLERTAELLAREQARLREVTTRTRSAWEDAVREADLWGMRALLAGGRDHLERVAGQVEPAAVRLTWRTQAGVTYPGTAALVPTGAVVNLPGPESLGRGAAACRRALEAAVQHAAATGALERVTAELTTTTRRLRAIRDRWLPVVEAELKDLDLALDERDRQELVLLRWGAR